MWLRISRRIDYPGLSRWAEGYQRFLKMEEGVRTQQMQVDSRNSKKEMESPTESPEGDSPTQQHFKPQEIHIDFLLLP